MQKAIHIEQSKIVTRVLSIAESSILEGNCTELQYFLIDDYVEPPMLMDIALDKAYPMYNTETKTFFWQVVNYQTTATEETLKIANLEYEVLGLQRDNNGLKEVVDTLLLESLLGGDGNA